MNDQVTGVRVTGGKRRVGQPVCEHATLKLETSGVSFTGNFYCIGCGESVAIKPQISLKTASID